ncbi:hypothetical protein Nmel_009094 [Mimus melanotis]
MMKNRLLWNRAAYLGMCYIKPVLLKGRAHQGSPAWEEAKYTAPKHV